jgi:hypothetical protein
MPGKVEIVKIDSDDIEDIKTAAIEFKDSVAKGLKGLKGSHVEVKGWRFGTESNEEGIVIDVSVKLLIAPKSSE